MDEDVDELSREALIVEVKRLREGIRAHRDSSGQELCWHHPQLWSLLPARTDALPVVPSWPEFLHGCVRYRRSLDDELEAAPRRVSRATEHMSWQRLDVAGFDACALVQLEDGWRLSGAAVFRHDSGSPAWLAYEAECDDAWRSRGAHVSGFIGADDVGVVISREVASGGRWRLNGADVREWDDCVDVDFGFTPATNLFQLRRIALDVGARADVPVAWLDIGADGAPQHARVAQHYERRSATTYAYESPAFDYREELDVGANGFVRRYPKLCQASGWSRVHAHDP